jgi:hypothetical protein
MSGINGDKARFHRIKKARAVKRERNRIMRKKLSAGDPGTPKGVSL